MGVFGRLLVFAFLTITNAVVGIIYTRGVLKAEQIGNEVVDLSTGPAAGAMESLDMAVYLFIAIVQIGAIAYVIVSPVTQERAVGRAR